MSISPLKEVLSDVNEAQWRAITHEGSHLLIVAGPGTGKTHLLAYRILRCAEHLKDYQRVLAVTFTNKAAREMSERLSPHGVHLKNVVTVGTFHSFCLELLRQFNAYTSLPADFKIAAPQEIEILTKEIWPDRSLKDRKNILEGISRFKSAALAGSLPEDVAAYDQFLRAKGFLDFDDLLLESAQLLMRNAEIRTQIQDTYRYIFVDEYQDINPAQRTLLKILVDKDVLLTAIGDPNQAIYGFRGADVQFFENFAADFPGTITMKLSENYRSAVNLLKASGQVIAKNEKASLHTLNPQILTEGRLTIYTAPTDRAEAEYVVHQIEQMVGGTSMFSIDSGRVAAHTQAQVSFSDVAVLYRLNYQKNVLEEALGRSGIPYRVSGDKPYYQMDLPQDSTPIEDGSQKVSLLTLHAAKGLEFGVVFIVGCEENLIPLRLKGFSFDLAEERRLFYVGMTRAKEKLFLLRAQQRYLYGQKYEQRPSLFLSDIEEELKAYEEAMARKSFKKKSHEKQLDLFSF